MLQTCEFWQLNAANHILALLIEIVGIEPRLLVLSLCLFFLPL